MEFTLKEGLEEYQTGIIELLKERGHSLAEDGILIGVSSTVGDRVEVDYTEGEALISCQEKVHFYRALAHLVAHCENRGNEALKEQETVYFYSNGAMLDCSRNGVLKVEEIKKYIRCLAALGMNTLMLYTEDTYEVKEYPYFGAFRGRYSRAELEECDCYAELFGIEMIPCIQTLGHLHTPLRWPAMNGLRDTADILLAGEDAVYQFLEACIRSASAPFRSKRIHLGMDEAHELGLGRYLKENGYQNRFEIMTNHLNKVNEICMRLGLEPMIWSDMYFRLHSKTGDYYDLPEDTDFTKVPTPNKNIAMVYWDYYNNDKKHYHNYFRLHQQLSEHFVFAGGGWTWNGLAPNYARAMQTTNAALTVCKEDAVKTVICTFWQDNGAETPMEAGIPTLVYFAEHGFHKEVDEDKWKDRLAYFCGKNYEGMLLLDAFDNLESALAETRNGDNPSKYLFYQDILTGLFDKQIEKIGAGEHYRILHDKLKCYVDQGDDSSILSYYKTFAKVLELKSELGIYLYQAYQSQNKQKLQELVELTLIPCIENVKELKEKREKIWFRESKPFGFEVLDIKFGGVLIRLESAAKRLGRYIDGTVDSLPELEEERLLYLKDEQRPEHLLCECNLWESIVSAGNVYGV